MGNRLYWFIYYDIFCQKNVKSVGFDVDSKKVKQINSGILPIPELKNWFGFDIKQLSKKNWFCY